MEQDDLHKMFLDELYRQTQGDTAARISMYEVGAALGLDRNQAGALAETLIVDGLVELKTLAGGIGITDEGLTRLGFATPADSAASTAFTLGRDPVAGEEDRRMTTELLLGMRQGISGRPLAYEHLEQLILDLKSLELHLLSPKPKTAVLRELLVSLQEVFLAAGIQEIVEQIDQFTGNS